MLPTSTLEERVAALEHRLSELTQLPSALQTPSIPWWRQIKGVFAEDADFEEAIRIGREYREAQRPTED